MTGLWAPVEGKCGKTRDGRKATAMVETASGNYQGKVADDYQPHRYWRPDGRHLYADETLDLVAEWPDEPASPVRTVTRTIEEVVIDEGQFGRVRVNGLLTATGLKVEFSMSGGHTAAEIDEAIGVLIKLSNALRQIGETR